MSSAVRIGYVFRNISGDRIANIFNELGLGKVVKIDFTERTDRQGTPYYLVHVHIEWNTEDQTKHFRAALERGEEVKIVYDEPWFWKVTKPRERRQPQVKKQQDRPAPRLVFSKTNVSKTDNVGDGH